MLREVRQVEDSNYGKFWVEFDCGHQVLCDSDRTKRNLIWPNFNTECPFCLKWDIEPGQELEVYFSFDRYAPTIVKYMGEMVDGRLRFILPDGEPDYFLKREIIRYKKL